MRIGSTMKTSVLLASLAVLTSSAAEAAVGLAQAPNAADRSYERLPALRLLRGATLKTIPLNVSAEAGEGWTISTDVPWASVTPTSGTGPATVRLSFDGTQLKTLGDPSGAVTVEGDDGLETNKETITIEMDIFPNVFEGPLLEGSDRAALIDYAKSPANWPRDGFDGGWELWGFMPDNSTHPNRLGDNVPYDVQELTPCDDGQTVGCTRDGQAGLTAGMKVDQGWLLSTGDPRTVIGVLDSGIKWNERDLVHNFYLNPRELTACPPPGADLGATDPFVGFDVNGDGRFNIRDYDDAPWLEDINFNGIRDPQDLIWGDDGGGACSDGIDDDNNGYVDDISGWDFFWNDNDPSDDSNFGHGTGEANDSASEINDDGGRGGLCPRCSILNVRVGDSFVIDVNQFAEGAIFVVDSGAHVIQEALGTINNTRFAQQAIDYAYFHNVPIVASAADETSYHHNYPGSVEHTLYVHAITHDGDNEFDSTTFQNFNNCTNFGGHLALSTPGESCSSEAVGNTAGQVGLLLSYYRQLGEAAVGTAQEPYYSIPMSAEEVYQTLIMSAEDIDIDGAETDDDAKALRKFPSNEGWDLHFGWGRNDVRRSMELVRDQRIPAEANISKPIWFEVFDPNRQPTMEVRANVSSERLTDLRWELHLSEKIVGAPFTKVAEGTGAVGDGQGTDDVLAVLTLKNVAPELVARAGEVATGEAEQFSAALELRTFGKNAAGETVQGVFRKTFGIRADDSTFPGFPIYLGTSGESSPKLTDLDGNGTEEIVIATSDGVVHAFKADGTEIDGFPVNLPTYASVDAAVCEAAPEKCHRNTRAYQPGTLAGVDPSTLRTSVLATVAVGNLDGSNDLCRDVVVASLDGIVSAFNCKGVSLPGFPVTIDRTTTPDGLQGARRCEAANGEEAIGCRSSQAFAESGFFSSPMLVDLDTDGTLEIIIPGLDARMYVWQSDGTLRPGFPVHVRHPTLTAFDNDGDIRLFEGRIVASPTVADLNGDGVPFIIVGTNERLNNSNSVFLYAIHPDGDANPGGAFPDGWPTTVSGFIPDEILPFVGRGNPNSPCAADFDGDGDDEVVNAGMGGFMQIIDADGSFVGDAMKSFRGDYGPFADVDDSGSLPVINNPSVADLDGDGRLELINGTAGLGLIQVASQGGKRSDFDHGVGAWVADNGFFLDGFPKKVADYQFFMNYTIADIDGDGQANVISGDGGYFVWATNPDGSQAPGFPKWTQGWHITTPAVGDLNGDELIDVVASTREGWLYAWKTTGHVGGPSEFRNPAIQWESFHRDDQNTANATGKFANLKPYPRLDAPEDDVCADGCCCEQGQTNNSSLAGFAAAGILLAWRRRRRAASKRA